MDIHFLSVIPEVFGPYVNASILGRAQAADLARFFAHDLRDWTHDRHRTVDDAPFGGGQGMLMKPEPFFEAVEAIRNSSEVPLTTIFLSPQGAPFTQAKAHELSGKPGLLLVSGRYEGMDERVFSLADEVVSLGDFVLTGGELAAMAVADAAVRLIPGVLGNERSAVEESFEDGLLECAQYTRPAEFRGMAVPDVLLSGDHGKVDEWRRRNALERTRRFRPDLLEAVSGEVSDRGR